MTIGVLGGAGFVGSGICRALTRAGHTCTVITRTNYDNLRGTKFDVLVNANGNSKKYLAAQSPREEFQASVASVQQSLLDFTFERYVHCSTVDVYANHEDPSANTEDAAIDPAALSIYGLHKYLAEQLVRRYAKRWIIFRFGGFVGEGLKKNSIFDILHGQPVRVDLDSVYQYLPTDAAGAIIDTLLRQDVTNDLFNACGDGVISLREVAAAIPGANVQFAAGTLPKERYEVSIGKIRRAADVPKTRESVLSFLAEYRKKSAGG